MADEELTNKDLFNKLKKQLLMVDPVAFCQEYLTLDGKPFTLKGSGYRPFADIYRYVGVKALEPTAKPLIIVAGRQVGKTTMASALEMYFMGSGMFGGDKPPIRVIHAFPQLEMAASYSKTKLNQMISASSLMESTNKLDKRGSRPKSYMQALLDQSSPTNDSLTFKQFIGGNHLWIESTGLDADRLRGRTADVIFFDECQKISTPAIGNALKILTASHYGPPSKGVQIYFGTPRRQGSDFHKMWQTSSQQYYWLGCEKCEQHFPLYTPGKDDWQEVWLYGFIVKCKHCGHEQNKLEAAERGKWIAYQKDEDDCRMIGFHINQLYMPMFSKEDILNEMPGKHPINTERVFQNEVLGEFFQGDSSPISPEEIRIHCGDVGRKQRARIAADEEQMVVMGIDYGAKADLEQLANPDKVKSAGQSYSTAVILSVKGPDLLSIERAVKFKRNDIEGKKGILDKLMRDYSVQLAIGDIGFSNDFSTLMHTSYGDRYLVSRAHNKVNGHVKFSADAFPKEIVFERDHYISEAYELMKKGQFRFPYGDYEQIAWLVEHCANMEIKPSISRVGEPTIHYVKSGPNDGFMSILNAYLAYKFLLTKGFTTRGGGGLPDVKDLNKPLILGAYIPRRF